MWLSIMDLLQGVEWWLFVEWVSRQAAWRSDVESLQLLMPLEGQLLSGCLTDLLTPKQARLLEGKERGTTLVLMD